MTTQEAINTVSMGGLVECTATEYPEIRDALQTQAAKWIDQGEVLRAQIAFSEVKRLDAEFNYRLF